MNIYSSSFFIFFLFFVIIHELVFRLFPKQQWLIRLIASLTFYLYIAKIRIIFILLSAASVWLGGIIIDNLTSKYNEKKISLTKVEKKTLKKKFRQQKNGVIYVIILFNLALFSYVKYYLPVVNNSIALPLGISYYTFMAISYLIDIGKDKYPIVKNPLRFLLFISWFPQIIQGPINRYDLINNTLYREYKLSWSTFKKSSLLFIFGAIKKYAIADILSPIVDNIMLGDIANTSGSYILFGGILRAVQQYGDFSGGIDMVIAVSCIFGVQMSENFRQPYFAPTLAEFWRRWHISLGSWMKDYIFYPFALNEHVQKFSKILRSKYGQHISRTITCGIANIFVFELVGIWHGIELHYILWGLYQGIIISLSDAFSPIFVKVKSLLHINDSNHIYKSFQILRTFMIIVLAGFIDSVSNIQIGFKCFENIFKKFQISAFYPSLKNLYVNELISIKILLVLTISILVVLIVSIMKEKNIDPVNWLSNIPTVPRWAIYYILVFTFLLSFTVTNNSGGFMYAAF